MCSTSDCASSKLSTQLSTQISTQISTAVAKKSLDAQAEQGREIVKMISSAQAIQDANAQISAETSPTAVNIYA
jgi:hypothetical protein